VNPLNPRYERLRWQTFAITWLVYAGYYLTRQSLSVAKVALQSDPRIALSRQDLGLMDSTYLTVYSAGQFVFGVLSDRFGPRRILLSGMLLSILAAVGFGFSTTLAAFLGWAVLQGVAQSTGWTATTKTMSSWFSLHERGRVLGWWCTHYTVGGFVAAAIAGWLMDFYARSPGPGLPVMPYWPAAFWGPAVLLAMIFGLTWLFLNNRPEDVGLPPIEQYHAAMEGAAREDSGPNVVEPDSDDDAASARSGILAALASPGVALLATAYFPIKLARYSLIFWGPKFVEESLGTAAFSSALTAAWMSVGGVIGVILSGYLSDKVFGARRAPVIVLSLILCAAVMSVGLTNIDNLWVMRVFFFFIGVFLFGPDSLITATAAIDFGTKRGAGTAAGVVNGVGSLGAILGGYLPGVLTSETDWTVFFQISVVALITSALILTPLWRTKPPAS
jgi:sugar phosphate permease